MFYYLMSKNATVIFYTSKWFVAYEVINNKFIIVTLLEHLSIRTGNHSSQLELVVRR